MYIYNYYIYCMQGIRIEIIEFEFSIWNVPFLECIVVGIMICQLMLSNEWKLNCSKIAKNCSVMVSNKMEL